MMNKLSEANSPYLLQHADNPVDWSPWGEAALQKAKSEDKPIFLSIGYAACHWCHVMAHESFEDPDTAAIMNEHFINIKVDREERPDIDNIYMTAVVAMIGQGGWPLSVFLTPDGQPFYGGTYFPPFPRYNMPSFRDVLLSVARAWKEDRQKIIDSSHKITEYIQEVQTAGSHNTRLEPDVLQKASLILAQTYDWDHGGWGRAPKFPQPMAIEYLLQRASLGDKFSLEISSHALDAMAKGGMYDVVGGGFSRYSTDDEWLVPHFEKMLYDNAQLSQVYLHAYLLTGNVRYREICEKTLDFVLRELSDPRGGFYSSLDADSEGEEGKFYVWTLDEIYASLKDEADAELLIEAYGVTKGGNFEGKNVLQRKLDDQALADRFNMSTEAVKVRLEQLQDHLLLARSARVRPGTDDKVITSWNALMMTSFAEAGRYLDHEEYLQVARRNAAFLLDNMFRDGILLRSWRNGNSEHFAYLDDYAALALGLIALYQSDPDVRWFKSASALLAEIHKHFRHPDWGFYDTRDDHQQLIVRPRDLQDNAVPSGNALAAQALLMMSAYTADGDLRSEAEKMLAAMQAEIKRYPIGFARWLSAFDFLFSDVKEVAILGDPDSPDTNALRTALWSKFRPHLVSATSAYPPPEGAPPLLMDRPLKGGTATAFVCQNFVCQQPVNSPEQLITQLDVITGLADQD